MTRQRHEEIINSKFIDYIIQNNYEELADYDKKLLPKLKSKNNKVLPLYKKGGVFLDDRNWCSKGLAGLSRRVRNTLAYQHYIDVDIKSSVYAVLVYLGEKYDLDIPCIEDHYENRDTYLNKWISKGKSRDEAKKVYARKPFDNYTDWYDNSKMTELDKEIKMVQDFIWNHPDFQRDRLYVTKKGQQLHKNNPRGKLLAHIYFTIEWAIVEKAMDFLETKNCFAVADLHDGFFVPKSIENNLLNEMNSFIKNECGYEQITFIKKEMNEFLDIPKEIIENFEVHGLAVAVKEYTELKEQFEKIVGFVHKPKRFIERHSDGTFSEMTKDDLINGYEAHKMFIDNNSFTVFTPKAASFVRNWLKDCDRKTYDDKTFIPCLEDCPPRLFNTFTGFFVQQYQPEIIANTDYDDLNIIKNHIKELCNDNTQNVDAMNNYVLDWLAHLFQKPCERPNSMLIFKAGEGIGKTMFVDFIASMMCSENKNKYTFKTSKPEQYIFGDFNDAVVNKMLICFEELNKNQQFIDKLKDFVTNDTVSVNAKFQQRKEVKVYHRVIATTNNENVICVSDTNRRFVPIESKREKMSVAEIKDTVKAFSNPNAMKLFYNELMQRDIENRDFSDFVKSNLYNRLMATSSNPAMSFIVDYFGIEKTFAQYKGEDYVGQKELYVDYKEYCEEYRLNYKDRRDFITFVNSIGDLFKDVHHKKFKTKILTFDFISVRNYLKKRGYTMAEELDSGNCSEEEEAPTIDI